MFLPRIGLRATVRTASVRPPLAQSVRNAPRFPPRRSIFSRPRYTRFGDKDGKHQQWSNFGPVYRAQYLWRNYHRPILVVGIAGGTIYVYNLEEVPITHRRRFNLLSPNTEKEILGGEAIYNQMLQELRGRILPSDHPLTIQVAQVVERLVPTTGGLAGDDWRVHVVDEPSQKNAFVMPGGKVFVFTGILPICQNEDGLATVLGHEIAHNVAHHAAERASRGVFVALAAIVFSLLFDVTGDTARTVVDLLLSLPNSRTQEAEADQLGIQMMAEACYDPQEALAFWARMKKAEEFEIPQFMSTHPSHENRAERIKQWLPEAQITYTENGCVNVRSYLPGFTRATASQRPHRDHQVTTQQQRRDSSPNNDDDDDDYF